MRDGANAVAGAGGARCPVGPTPWRRPGLRYYYYRLLPLRNSGLPTIERALFEALLAAELVSAEEVAKPQLIMFQRAARTDKGVSAARQVGWCEGLLNVEGNHRMFAKYK